MAPSETPLETRLRLAHQARRAKEHQLDGIRRALCDVGAIEDDDPYGHADLEDVIRQAFDPAEPEHPAPKHTTSLPVDPPPWWTRHQKPTRDDLWHAIEREVYEFRERTTLWGETDGITEIIVDLARRAVQPALDELEQKAIAWERQHDKLLDKHGDLAQRFTACEEKLREARPQQPSEGNEAGQEGSR